ncbi:phosphoglycolate phosphatase [Nioella nitratireducens]|uniref:phosphoglycolate phosphatase n=1 Tax=Nioella nitratireducens TaxID=1287720 RepID=UPI0008FD89EB|nr:phosphoglycolate phosphatase [Nioella nitratireducens]
MARIVFDLDGTLIDSLPDIHAIANAVLAEERAEPLSLEEARGFVGKGAAVFVARMRAARGLADADQERLHAGFVGRYDKAVGRTHPYPGAVAALESLRATGHRLGLCTNKPMSPTRAVLDHLDLARFFDSVLGGDSLAAKKPDPAPLHAVFAALGNGPMIYVGDSEVDAETAVRAGVAFLLFTQGYRKTPVAELPHAAAFEQFDALPGLVAGLLDQSVTA